MNSDITLTHLNIADMTVPWNKQNFASNLNTLTFNVSTTNAQMSSARTGLINSSWNSELMHVIILFTESSLYSLYPLNV